VKKVIKKISTLVLAGVLLVGASATDISATSNSKVGACGSYGSLTTNVWRSTNATTSGNTLQWDYQVSATYDGSYTVKEIRTTWNCSASLRSSASITLGISATGFNAGTSSSWQTVSTDSHYWSNTNGATSSSYRSNVCVGPKSDYREGTICTYNTGKVQLKVSSTTYSYNWTASC